MLLCGFAPEDLCVLAHHAADVFPGLDASRLAVVTAPQAQQTVAQVARSVPLTLQQAAQHHEAWAQQQEQHQGQAPAAGGGSGHQVAGTGGRLVYLVGAQVAARLGHGVNDALLRLGLAPAVVGSLQPK